MEFGKLPLHHPAGREANISCGRWSMDSPQNRLLVPSLNILLMVTWENVQVENNELACVI